MKILLVSSSSGSHGGGEYYLLELATSLQALGHEVVTWVSLHSQMEPLVQLFLQRGLTVHRFGYTNTYHRRLRSLGAIGDWSLQQELAGQFRQSSADIIHINQQCVEDGLDLVKAVALCNCPALSTIHVTRSATSLGAKLAWLRDMVSKNTLRKTRLPLVGISKTSACDLTEFVNGNRELQDVSAPATTALRARYCPVYAVANGVSVPAGGDRHDLRSSVGVGPSDVVLGVVARIEHQKNPLFLCQVLSALPSFVHCIWVGDGRLRSELQHEITRRELSGRFHLTGWQDQAAGWMSAFDMFTLGSLYEGLPLALLEAMASGLACVASNVDGMQDVIEHGVNGFLCSVNDVDSWVKVLMPLIESPATRSQIGAAARRRYEAEFSIEAMAKRTIAVYEDVIRRG